MIERLDRTFSRFAIRGLIRYIVALNALVFILVTVSPEYADALSFNSAAIQRGEVWRLVSWIFLPNTQSPLWVLFYLMFTWWLGDILEATWGSFRLNAYYFLGMFLCIASAPLSKTPDGNLYFNLYLNLSLFLAVATLVPNMEILLFLILPVKMKWVAIFSLIFPALAILTAPLLEKLAIILCLGNYLVFFGPSYFKGTLNAKKNSERQRRFERSKIPANAALHTCVVCGATEVTHPDAEFRVSSDGHEYCVDHLPVRRTEQ